MWMYVIRKYRWHRFPVAGYVQPQRKSGRSLYVRDEPGAAEGQVVCTLQWITIDDCPQTIARLVTAGNCLLVASSTTVIMNGLLVCVSS
jgi:hypothetical protein